MIFRIRFPYCRIEHHGKEHDNFFPVSCGLTIGVYYIYISYQFNMPVGLFMNTE